MSRRSNKSQVTPPVGARVEVFFGTDWVGATVIEDRGNIGVGGRRLLRVRLEMPDTGDDPLELELPAADVKVAA